MCYIMCKFFLPMYLILLITCFCSAASWSQKGGSEKRIYGDVCNTTDVSWIALISKRLLNFLT